MMYKNRLEKLLTCNAECKAKTAHIIYEHYDGDREEICTVCGKWKYHLHTKAYKKRREIQRLARQLYGM